MFDAQSSKIQYSHPNFNGGKSAVDFSFNGVFPVVVESDPSGTPAATVYEQPKDNGGWTTRKHCDWKFDALLVNGAGYRVEMGDGSPVVYLNDVQVFPV